MSRKFLMSLWRKTFSKMCFEMCFDGKGKYKDDSDYGLLLFLFFKPKASSKAFSKLVPKTLSIEHNGSAKQQ